MTSTLPQPVAALLEAANAGDTEGFLNSFAADGFVNDWGRTFVGRDAILSWSNDEFIGADVSLTVTDASTSEEATIVSARVGGSGFNGPSHFTFTVSGDLVQSMKITA